MISFRLTIRNVNNEAYSEITETDIGFRLTIRNVNLYTCQGVVLLSLVLD